MENTEEKTVNENTGVADANDDKLIGILSYLGILWIVSFILYGNKKTEYNKFHVKEGLGLIIFWAALYILSFIMAYIPIINIIWGIVMIFVWIFILVLIIIGIINAANGAQKPLPLISKLITQKFLANFK